MSSIIQRLVMRARDPAIRGGTRIEPVLAVRYSSSAVSERAQEPLSPVPRAPDSRGHMAGTSLPPTHATIAASAALASPVLPVTPRQAKSAENGNADAKQRLHHIPAPRLSVDNIESASRTSLTETQTPTPENPAPTREPVEAKTILAPADAPVVTARPLPENAPVAERTLMPIVSTPPRANAAPAREPAANIVQTTQEITISIGHIEIRGAPAQPAPKRSAFRPRISLGDFLGREERR